MTILPLNEQPASAGVALVTGGGSGIGKAVARTLAVNGWAVVICGRRESLLHTVASEQPQGIHAVQADISRETDVERLVGGVIARFGSLDLLVNNAAIAHDGPLEHMGTSVIEQMIRVNVLGTIMVTRACIPYLRKKPGSIINIGSVGAKSASRISAVYGATKAAVHHLTDCLAIELAEYGVRVNTVAPGPVATDIGDRELLDRLGRATPRGRAGRPEEIAWWVLQLAGGNADWITGTAIAVDGGASILLDPLADEAPADAATDAVLSTSRQRHEIARPSTAGNSGSA